LERGKLYGEEDPNALNIAIWTKKFRKIAYMTNFVL
jgi:hypothetical protein